MHAKTIDNWNFFWNSELCWFHLFLIKTLNEQTFEYCGEHHKRTYIQFIQAYAPSNVRIHSDSENQKQIQNAKTQIRFIKNFFFHFQFDVEFFWKLHCLLDISSKDTEIVFIRHAKSVILLLFLFLFSCFEFELT